jgi:hypothetical protein
VAFDPDAFVDVALEALASAGVRLRLHTWFAGVDRADESIAAVFVESKKGREAILPGVVIDASGDGDVFVAAGAPHDHVSIPPHLWFRIGVPAPLDTAALFRTVDNGRWLVPWGPHSDRVDACDPDDMTRAELACRAGARHAFEAARTGDPALRAAWLDGYAGMLGITESRRLIGDYVLAKEDADAAFPDAIARTGHWTKRDVVYQIPLRCLTTAAADNLLVAGRCISTTRYVHQATKEIPAAMATGQAAGIAAAEAVAAGTPARRVEAGHVRRALRAAAADIGD